MNTLIVTTQRQTFPAALYLCALLASAIITVAFPKDGWCAQASPVVASTEHAAASTPIVITDITNWQHPTKAVFSKYGVKVLKVTITNKHPVFAVVFPFDPQTSPNAHQLELLCLELLGANGNWSYTLEAPKDGIAFEVKRDARTHETEINNYFIKNSP